MLSFIFAFILFFLKKECEISLKISDFNLHKECDFSFKEAIRRTIIILT